LAAIASLAFLTSLACLACLAGGCVTKVDLAPGKPDHEVSIFKSAMSPGLTRVNDDVIDGKMFAMGSEVRLPPGEHDMHLELNVAPTQNSGGAHAEWNIRFATLTGHTYTANGSAVVGLFVNKSSLTIRDDTSGVEMTIEK
jgi:hypothetical protein